MRYVRKDLRGRELIGWWIFWLVVAAAVAWPQATDGLAQLVGVERGADLLVYLSVLALFYAVFRILVSLERIHQDITTLTRAVALQPTEDDEQE